MCFQTPSYPTKDEAIKLTQNASETPPELFLQDKVLVDGKALPLKPGTAENFLRDFGMISFDAELPGSTRNVRACLLDNRCLVIRVSMKEPLFAGDPADESEGIVLFDAANSRAFARYVIAGRAPRISRLLLD
jgi:hypothetical protein